MGIWNIILTINNFMGITLVLGEFESIIKNVTNSIQNETFLVEYKEKLKEKKKKKKMKPYDFVLDDLILYYIVLYPDIYIICHNKSSIFRKRNMWISYIVS